MMAERKLVIGRGRPQYEDLNEDELKQRAKDFTEHQIKAAALQAETDRVDGIRSDKDRVQLVDKLNGSSAAEIDKYVDGAVTDIGSAKFLLAAILKTIALDRRR